MNHPIRLKTTAPPLLMTLTLFCLGLLPQAQAVVPPPDGGYANFTTAEGTNALLHLTSGAANTGLGWSSLLNVNTGSFNTGVGAGTLVLNTADSNTGVGTAALLLNTTGDKNVAVGTAALVFNDSGRDNAAVGAFALYNNVDGSFNTAIGEGTLFENITCTDNTAIGDAALAFNDVTGAGLANNNTAVGSVALTFNTDGDGNSAVGALALFSNTTGPNNTATGFSALHNNTEGSDNTAIGVSALGANISGSGNTALGVQAGSSLTTGDNNIDIGNTGVAGESDTIRIGSEFQTRTFISAIRGVTTGIADAVNVVIDSNGQLGTMSSSRRFKKEIKPMEQASEAILSLKPVTFHYRSDTKGTPQFGLIAEDVAAVNPDLVVREKNGAIYTVRYDAVNAMLLNEFLKEHRRVEELQATVAQQQKGMEVLTAQLKEQAAQIHKVSAQIEMNLPTAKVVVNEP
jgi:Chaperone of endosialidase